MKEIRCPHCNNVFSVDESTFESIALQVRNAVFNEEVDRRVGEMRRQLKSEFEAQQARDEKSYSEIINRKINDAAQLKSEIEVLREQLAGAEKNLRLQHEAERLKSDGIHQSVVARKDAEIQKLNNELAQQADKLQVALLEEQKKYESKLQERDTRINQLNSDIVAQKANNEKEIAHLREQHTAEIKMKDDEIQRQKDYKLRLSTKMLGESLEQHCAIMFGQYQSMGMFPHAEFGKDNDASAGSKGDFIFRDFDGDGREYISIMFEMKNEADATATKHRNEDFLEKLDKDRRQKNCEYAVLVSMLEQDSELYNAGIVNMSHRYDKMFVIRPQMFMIIISLLSQTARKNLAEISSLRQELAIARAQSVDVTNFEARRDKFVQAFGKLVGDHVKKQEEALTGIDKVIAALEKQAEDLRKVRGLFESSRKKLESANDKIETDFTIKKLTYGNKTMQAKFREAAEARDRLGQMSDNDT